MAAEKRHPLQLSAHYAAIVAVSAQPDGALEKRAVEQWRCTVLDVEKKRPGSIVTFPEHLLLLMEKLPRPPGGDCRRAARHCESGDGDARRYEANSDPAS